MEETSMNEPQAMEEALKRFSGGRVPKSDFQQKMPELFEDVKFVNHLSELVSEMKIANQTSARISRNVVFLFWFAIISIACAFIAMVV